MVVCGTCVAIAGLREDFVTMNRLLDSEPYLFPYVIVPYADVPDNPKPIAFFGSHYPGHGPEQICAEYLGRADMPTGKCGHSLTIPVLQPRVVPYFDHPLMFADALCLPIWYLFLRRDCLEALRLLLSRHAIDPLTTDTLVRFTSRYRTRYGNEDHSVESSANPTTLFCEVVSPYHPNHKAFTVLVETCPDLLTIDLSLQLRYLPSPMRLLDYITSRMGNLSSGECLDLTIQYGGDVNNTCSNVGILYNWRYNFMTWSGKLDILPRIRYLISHGLMDFRIWLPDSVRASDGYRDPATMVIALVNMYDGWSNLKDEFGDKFEERSREIASCIQLFESLGSHYQSDLPAVKMERAHIRWLETKITPGVLEVNRETRHAHWKLLRDHLHRVTESPLTLHELSRNAVRHALGGIHFRRKLAQLALPARQRLFIQCCDVPAFPLPYT